MLRCAMMRVGAIGRLQRVSSRPISVLTSLLCQFFLEGSQVCLAAVFLRKESRHFEESFHTTETVLQALDILGSASDISAVLSEPVKSCIPFWGIPLLLHLGKDTFSFVIDAMRAFWHAPVTFDFFPPTHVACLDFPYQQALPNPTHRSRYLHLL